jgi:hypothetical protein
MANRGLGEPQIKASKKAKEKILKVLNDGKYHRYKEIQEQTKLSTATLTKHLRELEKGIVERFEDQTTKEYPHPVSYRLKSNIGIEWQKTIFNHADQINLASKKSNGIYIFIKYINTQLELQILANLRDYFDKNGNKNEIAFNQSLDLYALNSYREAISTLKDKLKELPNATVNSLISDAEEKINMVFSQALKTQ